MPISVGMAPPSLFEAVQNWHVSITSGVRTPISSIVRGDGSKRTYLGLYTVDTSSEHQSESAEDR